METTTTIGNNKMNEGKEVMRDWKKELEEKTQTMVNRITMEKMVDELSDDLETNQNLHKQYKDEFENGLWDSEEDFKTHWDELNGVYEYITSKIQSLNSEMGRMDKIVRDKIINQYEGKQ